MALNLLCAVKSLLTYDLVASELVTFDRFCYQYPCSGFADLRPRLEKTNKLETFLEDKAVLARWLQYQRQYPILHQFLENVRWEAQLHSFWWVSHK